MPPKAEIRLPQGVLAGPVIGRKTVVGEARQFRSLVGSSPTHSLREYHGLQQPEITPLPEVSLGLKKIANHELNHGIALQGMGLLPLGFSFKPDKESLARTYLPHLTDDQLQVACAAGALPTVYNAAEGFGGDLSTLDRIDMMNGYSGGSSRPSAMRKAASYVFAIPKEVRDTASILLADKGAKQDRISTTEYLEIMVDAWRLANGKIPEKPPELYEASDQEIAFILESLPNDIVRIIPSDGKTVTGEIKHYCRACMGMEQHNPWCNIIKSLKLHDLSIRPLTQVEQAIMANSSTNIILFERKKEEKPTPRPGLEPTAIRYTTLHSAARIGACAHCTLW